MGEIASIYVEIGAKIDGLTSALNAVQKQLNETKDKTEAWGAKFTQVGRELAVVGAAITGALTAIVVITSKAGDEFDEMAAKTGISTEVLSTLKLAADKSGTSIGAVAAGMKFLATQMIEASSAGDKSKTVLGAMGITATDATGKLRPMNDVLFDVADRFAGMEAGAIKTKLAVAIFGRAGMDMIPILDLGRKGLQENEEAARKLGIEWSGASAKSAAVFADAMVDLKAAGTGLGKTIAEALMPMVKSIAEAMTGAIVKVREWAEKNPELAKTLESVALGIGGVATVMGGLMLTIPKMITSFGALASALSISTAALAASVAGLTVLVSAAILAYNTINNLTKAKEYATEADYRAFEASQRTAERLREVAHAAGLTMAAFHQLELKYNDNYTAMESAIRKGKEGKEMQDALSASGKAHAKVLEEQTAASLKLDPALQAILDSLEKGKKATDDEAKAMYDLAESTLATLPAVIGLKMGVQDLATEGNSLWPIIYQVAWAQFEAKSGTEQFNYALESLSAQFGLSEASFVNDFYEPIRAMLFQMYGIQMPEFKNSVDLNMGKGAVQGFSAAWDGAFSHLTQAWGDTFQKFVETWSWDRLINGQINFKDFFADIWGNIKDSFFTLIGDMAAKWAMSLLTDWINPVKEVGKALTENVGGALDKLASSSKDTASGLLSSLGSIGSIVTALTSVLELFKGPEKQTDVTYWLKFIRENIKEIRDLMFINLEPLFMQMLDTLFEARDNTTDIAGWLSGAIYNHLDLIKGFIEGGFVTTRVQFDGVLDKLSSIWSAISGVGSQITDAVHGVENAVKNIQITAAKSTAFASGGIAYAPTLATVAETQPEIIMPLTDYMSGRAPAGLPAPGGSNITLNMAVYAQTLDRQTIDKAAEYLTVAVQRQLGRKGL